MLIAVLGPTGSGKTTQSRFIMRNLGIPTVSVGSALHDQLAGDTALGKKAQAQIDRGDPLSDDLIRELVQDRLTWKDALDGAILDGYPRVLADAQAVDEAAADDPEGEIVIAFVFEMAEQELRTRIVDHSRCPICDHIAEEAAGERCPDCGSADLQATNADPAAVAQAMQAFQDQTASLREKFETEGVLYRIDANGNPSAIRSVVMEALGQEGG